ncbi:sigma-70 family RNA polymerase sigma factor [Neobacillus dielmonensis]|uniref:sigma-70 family RNA polymerase sigma factor n=1 Tax=Neobacillus dielmonensis TaxID=1347369 RepID=UPI0005A7F005|nr:sigma-70 family RNA polymerase sigma factor [Neobacillus dielmonensis]
MKVDDSYIVEQMKLKNEKSISILLDKYGGLLYAIIQNYLQGNRQDQEECVADVLVSIWYHIDSFDSSRNEFKNWIAAIAKYKAIDYVRKAAKEMTYLSKSEWTENSMDQTVSESKLLDLQSLLEKLSDIERAIFEKYYLEGVSSREIATEFKAKDSWVYNRLSRGRKKLRNLLMRNEV